MTAFRAFGGLHFGDQPVSSGRRRQEKEHRLLNGLFGSVAVTQPIDEVGAIIKAAAEDVASGIEPRAVGDKLREPPGRVGAVHSRQPDVRRTVLVQCCERDLRAVARDVVADHLSTGQNRPCATRFDIRCPEFARSFVVSGKTGRAPTHQIEHRAAGPWKRLRRSALRSGRYERIPFAGDLPLASFIANPDGLLTGANRGQDGSAIGIRRDAFFLRRSVRELFGRPVREALSPQVIRASTVRRKIHPHAVRRPRRRCALPAGADPSSSILTVHRDQATWLPHWRVHLGDEHPGAVR